MNDLFILVVDQINDILDMLGEDWRIDYDELDEYEVTRFAKQEIERGEDLWDIATDVIRHLEVFRRR